MDSEVCIVMLVLIHGQIYECMTMGQRPAHYCVLCDGRAPGGERARNMYVMMWPNSLA